MPESRFRVIVPPENLPPRKVLVKTITASPFTLDLIATHGAIAFDVMVQNRDGVTANVILGENVAYILGANETIVHSNIQETAIQVSGIANGYVILHVLDLKLLQRLNAVEVT